MLETDMVAVIATEIHRLEERAMVAPTVLGILAKTALPVVIGSSRGRQRHQAQGGKADTGDHGCVVSATFVGAAKHAGSPPRDVRFFRNPRKILGDRVSTMTATLQSCLADVKWDAPKEGVTHVAPRPPSSVTTSGVCDKPFVIEARHRGRRHGARALAHSQGLSALSEWVHPVQGRRAPTAAIMRDEPSYEDAMTAGMHAVADGIARSIETALVGQLDAVLRWLAAILGQRPPERAELHQPERAEPPQSVGGSIPPAAPG